MASISIVPSDIVSTVTVSNVRIEVDSVELNVKARFRVFLNDVNNNILKIEFVELSGDDYQNWGSSDDYVINYVLNTLGLTQQTTPDPTPSS